MGNTVEIPESVKPEFYNFIDKTYKNFYGIEDLPFDMRSGVYNAFLRSKDIEALAIPDFEHWYRYSSKVYFQEELKFFDSFREHHHALTAALNEGFKLLEQIKKASPE